MAEQEWEAAVARRTRRAFGRTLERRHPSLECEGGCSWSTTWRDDVRGAVWVLDLLVRPSEEGKIGWWRARIGVTLAGEMSSALLHVSAIGISPASATARLRRKMRVMKGAWQVGVR
jgi:hypothetical protein